MAFNLCPQKWIDYSYTRMYLNCFNEHNFFFQAFVMCTEIVNLLYRAVLRDFADIHI